MNIFEMSLQEIFLDPLRFKFMMNALQAAVLVGGISGFIGVFVVVRGMSFFGDALAHSVVPGVALAYNRDEDIFIGGLIAGILTALGIGWLTRGNRVREDTAIGIVFVSMFALGVAIISHSENYSSTDLTHILFGQVLGVQPENLRTMAICGVVVVGTVLLFYKEFLLASYDPDFATILKLPGEGLRVVLLILIAVTIVASLQTVGVMMMLAMLIIPAATALLLVRRLHYMLVISSLIGAASGALGLFISYHEDTATGPSIVLTATAIFILTYALTQGIGWVRQKAAR